MEDEVVVPVRGGDDGLSRLEPDCHCSSWTGGRHICPLSARSVLVGHDQTLLLQFQGARLDVQGIVKTPTGPHRAQVGRTTPARTNWR